MKIKRVCAANIRDAMRQVREELGADAVILSNRRVSGGFEIVAAVDYDDRLIAAAEGVVGRADTTPPMDAPSPPPAARRSTPVAPERPAAAASEAAKPRVVWSQDPMLVEMQGEIKALRQLLEQQVTGLAWGDMARRQPARVDLLRRLLNLGLESDLCLRLADLVSQDDSRGGELDGALRALGDGLRVTGDDILTKGGVVALVGPTGVGKTTTAAKLAARYMLRHGRGKVALITTDNYRIGAYEQLRTYGMIMDTPVRLACGENELKAALLDFANHELVLIDTAGMSPRDIRLCRQIALNRQIAPEVRSYLVMAANAHAAALEETLRAFAEVPLTGCVLTKLDETGKLGAILSVLYERRLPVAYVSGGQRVPEDLEPARVDRLLDQARALAPGAMQIADESMAIAFGRKVVNGGV